jgi:hypothetical protein
MWADGPRILSEPVTLHWAGWTADTRRLQAAGWSISAQQDVEWDAMRLALRHEGMQIRGVTARQDWRYQDRMHEYTTGRNVPREMHVQHMASRLVLNIHEPPSVRDFTPVDAMPQLTHSKIITLDDLAHFAVPLARTQEIILPEENVPELLERILKMQQPAKTERLKRELAESREGRTFDHIPRQKFHAQILSIAA